MSRVTLSDVRASRIPASIGLCPDDERVIQFANEAVQRLLTKGHFWGTYARFRICATSGCITLPRQIATIERASVCGQFVPVYDSWYEFLENGAGVRESSDCGSGSSSCWPEALYRGHFPTFEDIRGTDKKARLVCDLATDVGKEVLILGYDENNNWIRTAQSGFIKDGEIVALAQAPGTNSTNKFSVITDIQAPDNLDGQWWLYEYNTTDTTQRLIGQYQYDETRPSYARYFFPSIGTGSDDCAYTTVNIIGKLDFVPVKNDTDYLLISNIPALKEMMRAIYLAENEADGQRANDILAKGEMLALRELNFELEHMLGSGRKVHADFQGSSIGAAEPVENFM